MFLPEQGEEDRCLRHGATERTESGDMYPAEGKAVNGEEKPIVKNGFKSKANESFPNSGPGVSFPVSRLIDSMKCSGFWLPGATPTPGLASIDSR
jgi:hypothetical protein